MAHLDHDHCESENIPLPTSHPPIQDLRCSPARSATTSSPTIPLRVRVLGDRSKAEISDAYPTGVINKNVLLARYQYDCDNDSEEGRTPLRSP